jgi:hypothetical protein
MGLIPNFQEGSKALKYVSFGCCLNKLQIFEVLTIASSKA